MVTAGSFRAGGLFIFFVKEMINIAIKLATSITYTADGSQTNFSIPFDYLRPSFVHVAVNDAEVSEGFTVSNRGIMFDTAPAKDALVKIYRKTPTSRLVSWADASILKAIDMTIAEVQQLHILEEASDWSKTNSIVLDEEGNTWQGRNCRMSNIADPTGAQDVVTKHYLDNEEGSFTATMNALKTKTEEAASTAETNAKQAQTGATNAKTSETNAKTSETNAKTSETNVNASKEAAQSAANSASNFATDARSSASEAKSYRDAASTYATNAKNYSENVNVFVPSVSTDGVLSWSNKAGLTNPPSVNIKGKDGADGGVTVDDALSDTSTNAIQNKVVKAALDNRAVLDDTNTFTSPNKFDDIYMADGMSSLKWYNGSPNFVVASINSERYTGEANTAKKATKDGDGNIITSTYATKTELNSCVKTVNNVAPDSKGNVNISVSGGSNVTVDAELSATSTNPVQNKVIEAALKNKASLDKNNTFSKENLFQKGMSLFAYRDSDSAIKWYQNPVEQPIASIDATNYTGTAAKATQDGAGNVITETYATKADVSGVVKSVNGTKPDASGNVNITVGSDVIVDNELSNTSTNPVQNKVVYEALDTKLGKNSFAYGALRDAEGNFITSTYVRSVNGVKPDIGGNVTINVEGGGSITVDTELSSTSTNAIANKAVYDALLGKAGTDIFSGFSLMGAGATINWRQGSQPVGSINATNYTGTASAATHDGAGNVISATYVKSVNNITPDTNGNVSIAVSGGGVSTSEANNWSAQQYFYVAKLQLEKYETTHDSGTTITPVSVITLYNATGNLTLNLTNLTSILSGGESLVFTAYITSAADYALTITNGGTIKYTGSPSDLAITSTGLLLNILITKDISNNITSIVQASKLS